MTSPCDLLTADVLHQVQVALAASGIESGEADVKDRYIGRFENPADLAKYLFEVKAFPAVATDWPFTHVDWSAAADALGIQGDEALLVIGNDWFDAAP